jgi:hypothetical protein
VWIILFAPALVRAPALCRRPPLRRTASMFKCCADATARGACGAAGNTYVSIVNCRKG